MIVLWPRGRQNYDHGKANKLLPLHKEVEQAGQWRSDIAVLASIQCNPMHMMLLIPERYNILVISQILRLQKHNYLCCYISCSVLQGIQFILEDLSSGIKKHMLHKKKKEQGIHWYICSYKTTEYSCDTQISQLFLHSNRDLTLILPKT